ncbi:MAG TPA: hypothetical protein VEV62_18200 [Parafilimonas sp.]|nr:hypothetical protein [Parafilimonas sp.]
MNENFPKKINIFISVDVQTINTYFNAHDPAPLYKRQLSHQFEQYILNSITHAKRFSIIFYKLKCSNDIERQYTQPLMYAIKRHFTEKKALREAEFRRFKKRSFMLLAMSLIVIVLCHGVFPLFLNSNSQFQTIILTSSDIFSWVILWKPIDKLIFDWNPHLKDISILHKLSTAEVMIINNAKEAEKKESVMFAVQQVV